MQAQRRTRSRAGTQQAGTQRARRLGPRRRRIGGRRNAPQPGADKQSRPTQGRVGGDREGSRRQRRGAERQPQLSLSLTLPRLHGREPFNPDLRRTSRTLGRNWPRSSRSLLTAGCGLHRATTRGWSFLLHCREDEVRRRDAMFRRPGDFLSIRIAAAPLPTLSRGRAATAVPLAGKPRGVIWTGNQNVRQGNAGGGGQKARQRSTSDQPANGRGKSPRRASTHDRLAKQEQAIVQSVAWQLSQRTLGQRPSQVGASSFGSRRAALVHDGPMRPSPSGVWRKKSPRDPSRGQFSLHQPFHCGGDRIHWAQ